MAFSAPSGRPNGKQYLEKSQHGAMNMLFHICPNDYLAPIFVFFPLGNFQKGLTVQMEESKMESEAMGKVS